MSALSRTRVVIAAVAIVSSAAGAQGAGRVFNPRVNPANPDLVAYETLIGDRQELLIKRIGDGQIFPAIAKPAAPAALIALSGLGDNNNVAVYSGDLDWRPRIDADGRQWFAYAASEQGVVKLFVNFVDNRGTLATREPIAIPYAGAARQPRWSADGHHLAFVSDSAVLHVIWNVDRAFRTTPAAAFRPTRISEAGVGALFPAWAPNGLTLAYQVERTVRGQKRIRIETLSFDTLTFAARGGAASISDDLTDGNAVRPSWSHDGRYVAFYVDRTGLSSAAATSGALDIAVTEVQLQLSAGRIISGTLLSGLSRRIADAVLVNSSRGPTWTRLPVGTEVRPAILYVQRDETRGNPIFVHSLDAWTARRARDESRIELSKLLGTVNHREATATESRGFVRYVYASVKDGGEALNVFNDTTAKWANGPAPLMPVRAIAVADTRKDDAKREMKTEASKQGETSTSTSVRTGGHSVGLAVIFPGAGQFKGGSKLRGALYSIAGIGGAGLALSAVSGVNSAADGALNARSPGDYASLKTDYDSKKQMVMIGAGVAGAAWLAGILDAAVHRGGAPHSVSVIGAPASSRVAASSLGLRVRFGRGQQSTPIKP